MTAINEINAHRFSDNFAIVDPETESCFGCEHNQEEAEAVAKWITYNRNRKAVVIKNGPDQVRSSKAIRGGEPFRYQLREEALTDMGVWASKKPRRRRA